MQKLPPQRWIMIGLCFVLLAISYVDRVNLAIAAPHMRHELGFGSAQMGLLLGAFFWSYALMQLPGGWIVDRIGAWRGLPVAAGLWSVFTMITAGAQSVAGMFLCRIMLGVGESGAYPGCTKVAYAWFPKRERGIASGIFDAGPQVGTALALPMIAWVIGHWGWRASFLVSGGFGLIWVCVWFFLYRDPDTHRGVTPEQRAALRAEQQATSGPGARVSWRNLFGYRTIWAMMIGFFCVNFVKYFFITWFPTYLMTNRGFSLMQLGTLGAIPSLMSVPGSLLGGWMTDFLYRKGYSLTIARKACLIAGMLASSVIALAVLTDSIALILVVFSIAYAACAFTASVIWTIPADIAPTPGHVASISGIQNFAANMAGVATSGLTGLLLALSHGSFIGPLVAAGSVCILGALNYAFLMGKVEPLMREPCFKDHPRLTQPDTVNSER